MDDKIDSKVQVLDHGYVRLVHVLGNELTIVNAARASFHKEHKEFLDSDARLIKFLIREGHWVPFRHVFGQFEVHAPLMVARQLWKYVVGSDHTMETAWSEASRRYVTEEPEFYIPEIWRGAPENKKQGSSGQVSESVAEMARSKLQEIQRMGLEAYEWAIESGIAPEQARLFLPAYGMYVTWRWTASLQALIHVFQERLDGHAQFETKEVVKAMYVQIAPFFPTVFGEVKISEM